MENNRKFLYAAVSFAGIIWLNQLATTAIANSPDLKFTVRGEPLTAPRVQAIPIYNPTPVAPKVTAPESALVDLSAGSLTINGKTYRASFGAADSPTPKGTFTLKNVVKGSSVGVSDSAYFIEFFRMAKSDLPEGHPGKYGEGFVAWGIHSGDVTGQSLGCVRVSPGDLSEIVQNYRPGDTIVVR